MKNIESKNRSIGKFILFEFLLSLPFWGINALAGAGVLPNLQMLNAAWSLTPMLAALILVRREKGKEGVKQLFRRCFDYRRIERKVWYVAILLLEPLIIFAQYGIARVTGIPAVAPQFSWLVPLAYAGFFIGVFGEELGWTGYLLDPMQERWSALASGVLLGIIWATFHAPVWILVGQDLSWAAWQFLYVVATRVLFVWLYNNAGKSLFAMALVHPGLGVYWYFWNVSANLGIPAFYDPRNLALTALLLAAAVTALWGPKTLMGYGHAHSVPYLPEATRS